MGARHSLLDCVTQALAGLGGPGVVAVSGGPDSVALLRSLVHLQSGPLVVAHVNHRLRDAESDDDEAFVRTLAERLAVAGRPISFRTAALAPIESERSPG